MNYRDKIRILAIDEKIAEYEEKLAIALEQEQADRKIFKTSKVIKYRIDKYLHQRTALLRLIGAKYSRRQTYDEILKIRHAAVNALDDEIEKQVQHIGSLGTNLAINPVETLQEIRIQNKVLQSLQLQRANKERALNNWLAKSENEMPITREAVQKVQTAEALKLLTIAKAVEVRQDRTPEDILKNNDNWNIKVENNASLDLITPPALHEEKEPVVKFTLEDS